MRTAALALQWVKATGRNTVGIKALVECTDDVHRHFSGLKQQAPAQWVEAIGSGLSGLK